MRELVAEYEPELLELVTDELADDPFERAGESTAAAQPAIFCASLALWARAGRPDADFFAGHSLGELTALVAAGAIGREDGLRLAIGRGALMEDAGRAAPGGMAALIGDEETARELAYECDLVIANYNNPGQLVASGGLDGIQVAQAAAKERRLRAIALPVAAAFHSPAMLAAVQPFRDLLEGTPVGEPRTAVLSCSTVSEHGEAEQIRDDLADALVRPVRWRQAIEELHGRGVRSFREAGPGKALIGMVKRTVDGVELSTLPDEAAVHV